MSTSLTVVVAAVPALVDALQRTGQFAQVLSVASTAGLRDLLASGILSRGTQDKVFIFADSTPVDTEQTLPFLISRLAAMGTPVIVVATSPAGRDLVQQCPGAGLLEGPLKLNQVLGALSGHNGLPLLTPVPENPDIALPGLPVAASAPPPGVAAPQSPFSAPGAAAPTPAPAPSPFPAAPAPVQPSFGQPDAPASQRPVVAAPGGFAEYANAPVPVPAASPFGGTASAPSPFSAATPPGAPAAPHPVVSVPAASDVPASVPASPFGADPSSAVAAPFGTPATAPAPQGGSPFTAAPSSPAPAGGAPVAPSPFGPGPSSGEHQPSPFGPSGAGAPVDSNPFGGPAPAAAPFAGPPTAASPFGAGAAPAFGPATTTPVGGAPFGPGAVPGPFGGQPAAPGTPFGAPVARAGADTIARQARRGHVITIAAPKGGTGKSSMTLNLAAYLGLRLRGTGRNVCLIDANVQQADAGKYLNAWTPNIEGLLKDPSAIHPDRITDHLLHRPQLNMSVLLGPASPEVANPLYYTGKRYSQILDALKPLYDYILIDTPVAELYHEMFRDFAIPRADFIAVVAAPNVTTLMNTDSWLRQVTAPVNADGMGVDPSRIGIVLNRAEDDIGIDEDEVRRELAEWRFLAAVPETKEWKRCNNANELVATRNYHELNEAFSIVLAAATGEDLVTTGSALAQSKPARGGLRRFFSGGKK